jgi:hypothetical protein
VPESALRKSGPVPIIEYLFRTLPREGQADSMRHLAEIRSQRKMKTDICRATHGQVSMMFDSPANGPLGQWSRMNLALLGKKGQGSLAGE